eukprot:TRINITY_DN5249_c0_g1_i4.p1 TRINITY_DN5249_c0_g1~~TRINITY_DN5249_c0_g1_i4.p1  ORF type:complete len:101 (+),score=27.38 TRINITY_DN5249_c0_g1_i4:112-414(+)
MSDGEAMEEDRRSDGKKLKGRGHSSKMDIENERYSGKDGVFEKIDSDASQVGPQRSVEGWIVFISGVHAEAQEEDIKDKFCEFGEIKNIHLSLDLSLIHI